METKVEVKEVTPEQQKELDKAGVKFVVSEILNGMTNVAMLLLINFILYMAVTIWEYPSWTLLVGGLCATIFIFRRIRSISEESYDELIKKIKEITKEK